jgi:hypothetical protein
MVDPQTRRRRRVSFPNAPPKKWAAGTVGDSQRRPNGMGHSADLRSLRETRVQTSDSLEFEGRLLNLLQGCMRPPYSPIDAQPICWCARKIQSREEASSMR